MIVKFITRGGARFRWWAGGLPPVSLNQRLALRSVALAIYLAQRPPSALICFLSSPTSPGSLITCRRAAQSCVTIYAFCVGFSLTCLPRLNIYGHWLPVHFADLPAVMVSEVEPLADHTAFSWVQQ